MGLPIDRIYAIMVAVHVAILVLPALLYVAVLGWKEMRGQIPHPTQYEGIAHPDDGPVPPVTIAA